MTIESLFSVTFNLPIGGSIKIHFFLQKIFSKEPYKKRHKSNDYKIDKGKQQNCVDLTKLLRKKQPYSFHCQKEFLHLQPISSPHLHTFAKHDTQRDNSLIYLFSLKTKLSEILFSCIKIVTFLLSTNIHVTILTH